jgi:hypothetical protein
MVRQYLKNHKKIQVAELNLNEKFEQFLSGEDDLGKKKGSQLERRERESDYVRLEFGIDQDMEKSEERKQKIKHLKRRKTETKAELAMRKARMEERRRKEEIDFNREFLWSEEHHHDGSIADQQTTQGNEDIEQRLIAEIKGEEEEREAFYREKQEDRDRVVGNFSFSNNN